MPKIRTRPPRFSALAKVPACGGVNPPAADGIWV
jgi:hypothetical protein